MILNVLDNVCEFFKENRTTRGYYIETKEIIHLYFSPYKGIVNAGLSGLPTTEYCH